GMITLAQSAGPSRMGQVMGVIGVPMLLGPVLGPVLGGLLVEQLSWRWIFYVNLPIGLVGLVLAAKLLPAERAVGRGGDTPSRLDWKGLSMLSPGVALVVFGLSEVSSHGAITPWRVAPIVLGALLVAAFARHALRAESPLVDVRLLRERGFAAASATIFLVGGALFGALLLLPLYFQIARGQSALQAGLLMMPQGLGAALGMNRAGKLTDRLGGGRIVLAGLAMLMVGTLPFTQVTATTPYWVLELGLVARGAGLGFTMMPAMAAAYSTLERSQVPRATPMLNVIQRVGGSLGTAVLAVVLESQLSAGLAPARPGGVTGPQAADAFAHTYWWAFGAPAIALVPAFLLARAQRETAHAVAKDAHPASVG
ncbi:MAG: DHA2 family efflux MFS transporter permease subunit, partial [Solirubrobacteraceae bacterium]